MKEEIELAKISTNCKSNAIDSIYTCYHPKCNEKSINSHILQKNGILSVLAPDKHLWSLEINNFKEPNFYFKKTGINQIFSFKCFCNKHDTELFKKIEGKNIDFNDYESCLLFTLRTVYNEIWRKEVNIKFYNCLLSSRFDIYNNPDFLELINQESLGLSDLRFTENEIWKDLSNSTTSFVFENKNISNIDLCLSAFYNYDTTEEINNYKAKFGKDMERVSEIFINLFPYKNQSILLMGYNKLDEKKVKGYFYAFFKESEKRVQRKLTNLMLFQCETWVVSEALYNSKIRGIESLYANAVSYSCCNPNERQTFDLNIFHDNFKFKFMEWNKKYVG